MSQQPKTETDQLSNVIQVLQLGQQTGRLIVERNDGSRFEQGTVTFVNGQVVQANVNQQEGPEALDWLKSWGRCRFAFSSEQRSGQTNRMSSMPLQPPQPPRSEPSFGRGFTSSLRNTTGHLPFPQSQQDSLQQSPGNSGKLSYPPQNGSRQSSNNSGKLPYPPQNGSRQSLDNAGRLSYPPQNGSRQSSNNSGKLPYPPQNGSRQSLDNAGRLSYPPQNGSRESTGDPGRSLYGQQNGPHQSIGPSGRRPYPQQDISHQAIGHLEEQRSPTAWLATPYRLCHIDDGMRLIEQMGLSRTHRRLFLLIDGRRSIKELMRLMAHGPVETIRLLQDLEGTGIIQMPLF